MCVCVCVCVLKRFEKDSKMIQRFYSPKRNVVYIHIYKYIHAHTYIHTYAYIHIYTHIYAHINVQNSDVNKYTIYLRATSKRMCI